MKVVAMRDFGGPEVLEYAEAPTPEPGPGEVLLRILASGTNRLEHYIREGSVTRDLPLPHVLGSDAAAEVVELGAEVEGFTTGDRVIPLPGFPLEPRDRDFTPMAAAPSYAIGGTAQWGTYAEYLCVPAEYVVPDPTDLPPEQVATLPMALITGVRAVRTVGGVRSGHRVLVQAGSSATGAMNIMVAKALGATVAATVDGAEKVPTAEAAGADLVVDVTATDIVEAVLDWTDGRGADVAIDNLGGNVLGQSLDAVRPQGTVVAMGFVAGVEASFHVREFFFAHKRILGTLMGGPEDLAWGLELVAAGLVRPLLDRTLPLADARQAHALMAANATRGTVVLVP
ncbi:zinc-binding dehydrogenase [Micromonospora sp. NPDC126480]|uniref:quinone oxidoreductase family protein n=1 Tax=Micromonospora sp. NPDC126480 TaxID=3155312 RepID=UPI0033326EEF